MILGYRIDRRGAVHRAARRQERHRPAPLAQQLHREIQRIKIDGRVVGRPSGGQQRPGAPDHVDLRSQHRGEDGTVRRVAEPHVHRRRDRRLGRTAGEQRDAVARLGTPGGDPPPHESGTDDEHVGTARLAGTLRGDRPGSHLPPGPAGRVRRR